MAGLSVKNLISPDETRTPDKTVVEVVDLGSAKATRMAAQPGWRWYLGALGHIQSGLDGNHNGCETPACMGTL